MYVLFNMIIITYGIARVFTSRLFLTNYSENDELMAKMSTWAKNMFVAMCIIFSVLRVTQVREMLGVGSSLLQTWLRVCVLPVMSAVSRDTGNPGYNSGDPPKIYSARSLNR